jgi:hypothetical protein
MKKLTLGLFLKNRESEKTSACGGGGGAKTAASACGYGGHLGRGERNGFVCARKLNHYKGLMY